MKTILIVEDEYDIANSLEMILQSEGYQVSHAQNGKEALSMLKNEPFPDLILTDIMMPVMDGYELTRELKKDAKLHQIPLILMSAGNINSSHFQSASFDHFVRKPFELENLLAKIAKLLKEA
jgi:CheY-like chemotaxis protein